MVKIPNYELKCSIRPVLKFFSPSLMGLCLHIDALAGVTISRGLIDPILISVTDFSLRAEVSRLVPAALALTGTSPNTKSSLNASILLAGVGARCKIFKPGSIDGLPVTVSIIIDSTGTDTLVRLNTGTISGTFPVGNTVFTGGSFPSNFAQAGIRLHAVSVLLTASLTADGHITEMTSPAFMALTSVGTISVGTISIDTSRELLTDLAVSTSPTTMAGTLKRLKALAILGITDGHGASRSVTESTLPQGDLVLILLTVALKSFIAGTLVTPWEWHTTVAEMPFPSNLAGADIWPDTVSMSAGLVIIVADRLRARRLKIPEFRIMRLSPARKADHIGFIIADVAMGILQILRHTRVLVIPERGEHAVPPVDDAGL